MSEFVGTAQATSGAPPAFVDPNATALLGLRFGAVRASAGDRRIEQLQQDLLKLGYLGPDIVRDVGYGKRFGRQTERAVRQLQSDRGLVPTGIVDEATVAALAGRAHPSAVSPDDTARLVGLQPGATAAPGDTRLAQLHWALMERGYLPAGFPSDPGFGKRFGARTLGAVERLQRDWGLTPTGVVEARTATALASHTRAAPELRAAWAGHPSLGRPSSPCTRAADGTLTQLFENGALTRAPSGLVMATDASGRPLGQRASGVVSTVSAANAFFLNQSGNTEFFQSFNASARPYGPNDCGPTSAVVVLAALGLAERPSASEAPHAIDAMRDTVLAFDSEWSTKMGLSAVGRGLQAYGAKTRGLDVRGATKSGAGLSAIDAALAAGQPVILGGTPGEAWARHLGRTGDYLDMGGGNASFGHFVALLGRTDAGGYLVADPLARRGTFEATTAQVGTFLTQGGWGEAVAVFVAP